MIENIARATALKLNPAKLTPYVENEIESRMSFGQFVLWQYAYRFASRIPGSTAAFCTVVRKELVRSIPDWLTTDELGLSAAMVDIMDLGSYFDDVIANIVKNPKIVICFTSESVKRIRTECGLDIDPNPPPVLPINVTPTRPLSEWG